VLGGKESNWTIGVNWYCAANFKLAANYVKVSSEKYNSVSHTFVDDDPSTVRVPRAVVLGNSVRTPRRAEHARRTESRSSKMFKSIKSRLVVLALAAAVATSAQPAATSPAPAPPSSIR
jgi:phosphate-selective porin